jgi:hypothetical protein
MTQHEEQIRSEHTLMSDTGSAVCKECGAPAEVEHRAQMIGTDFAPGSEALHVLATIRCAAGHKYNELLEDEKVVL